MNPPKIGSHDQWLVARKRLLAKEKDFTRARDRLNAERRRLPFNDLLSSATGAGLTLLLGGLVLTAAGMASLAIGAVALLIAPALWILLARDTSRRSS